MAKLDGMDPKLVRELLSEVQHAGRQMAEIEAKVTQLMRGAGVPVHVIFRPSQVADACSAMVKDVTERLALLEKKERQQGAHRGSSGERRPIRSESAAARRSDDSPAAGDKPGGARSESGGASSEARPAGEAGAGRQGSPQADRPDSGQGGSGTHRTADGATPTKSGTETGGGTGTHGVAEGELKQMPRGTAEGEAIELAPVREDDAPTATGGAAGADCRDKGAAGGAIGRPADGQATGTGTASYGAGSGPSGVGHGSTAVGTSGTAGQTLGGAGGAPSGTPGAAAGYGGTGGSNGADVPVTVADGDGSLPANAANAAGSGAAGGTAGTGTAAPVSGGAAPVGTGTDMSTGAHGGTAPAASGGGSHAGGGSATQAPGGAAQAGTPGGGSATQAGIGTTATGGANADGTGGAPARADSQILDTPRRDHPADVDQTAGRQVITVDGVKVVSTPLNQPSAAGVHPDGAPGWVEPADPGHGTSGQNSPVAGQSAAARQVAVVANAGESGGGASGTSGQAAPAPEGGGTAAHGGSASTAGGTGMVPAADSAHQTVPARTAPEGDADRAPVSRSQEPAHQGRSHEHGHRGADAHAWHEIGEDVQARCETDRPHDGPGERDDVVLQVVLEHSGSRESGPPVKG